MPSPSTASYALAIWLVANLVIVTIWDAWAMVSGNIDATVSFQLYLLFKNAPWAALIVGVAIGHLFLPLFVRNGNP